jgi:serine/threonine-protein kinase
VPDREHRLLDLAAAVADGAPVDWEAAESTAASDSERRQIQRLRLVHQVAAASALGSPGRDARPHESLLHPAGGDERDDTTDAAPVIWGPLRVIEKIGRGRFGDVYRAWDPRLDRDVALKLLRRRHADEDGAGSAAIEEGRLLAKVRHPNVVTVYGAERIENRVGLWMELIRGETLEQVVARGPLTADDAMAIGVTVCQALAAVHDAGLLHRDMKAQNVMREDMGRVVLMDFGTGRELDVDAPAEFAGTPLYLAPEVLAGAASSRQSDLYSVGVLLYHLVTGTFPVNGRTLADIRAAHARVAQSGALDPLDRLPESLRPVVTRALSRDPEARFASALDMAEALGRSRDLSATSSTQPPANVRRVDRRLVLAALIGGFVLLVVGLRGSEMASWWSRAVDPRVVIRPVWTGGGVDASGSPSPDGRYLTFTDWETGDLAIRDFLDDTSRRLTNTGGWAASGDYVVESAISPDGRWVVYAWHVEDSLEVELRVMPIDGRDSRPPQVLLRTELTDYVAPFGWTPDGLHVAVMRRTNERHELGLVAIADGAYRTVTTLDMLDERLGSTGVSLSPDGRYMAYEAPPTAGSPPDIFVVGTDGRATDIVVRSPHEDVSPVWAPDGSAILFLSDRTGTRSLWMVPVSDRRITGPAELVRADVGPIALIGISRVGALYYMLSGRSRQDVYAAELNGLRATTSPSRATERFVNSNIGPSWSADGEYLAYYSFRDTPTLVVRSTKTGAERDVALPAGVVAPFSSGPEWFPDNRSVLILVRDQGRRAFFRLWLDTARADLVHRTEGGAASYALAADGRTLYYAVQHTNARENSGRLMRFDIATGRSTVLKKDEWFIAVAISPDGSQLASLKSVRIRAPGHRNFYSAVEIIPSGGGEAREVFRDAPWLTGARYNTLAWTPDGQAIMFVRDDGRLWAVSANGGEPHDMGISMKATIKTPAVHPDGRRIVFGAIEVDNNEVWVIENVLVPAGVRQ